MANRAQTIAAQLGRLSAGTSRTFVRLASTSKKAKARPQLHPEQPGHGEKIWIFNEFKSGLTVYSTSPVLKANKALAQIPFNGKKLKPAKIRKDYWRPLAMVQFPEGFGEVGKSVYHLLREYRVLHDTAWGDEVRLGKNDEGETVTLSKQERGKKLNDQKANSIADLAAVLGGAGKGNKIWMTETQGGDNVETNKGQFTEQDTEEATGLVKATILWSNPLDRNYAESWSPNVLHSTFESVTLEQKPSEPASAEASQ